MRLVSAFLLATCCLSAPTPGHAQTSEADRLDRASEFLDKAAEARNSLQEIDRLYDVQAKTLDEQFRSIRQEYDTATLHNSQKFAANMAALALDLIKILKATDAKEKAETAKDLIEHSMRVVEVIVSDQKELPAAYRAAMAKYRVNLQTLDTRRVALENAQRTYSKLMQEAATIGMLRPAGSEVAKAPSDIGAWKLTLSGLPKAELPFKEALLGSPGTPAIQGLTLSCGPQNTIAYRIASASALSSLDITEGEDSTHILLESGGRMAPKQAVKFAKAILKQLTEYNKQKSKDQGIQYLTPDMHGDTINFYGFAKARSALKEACAKASPSPQATASALPAPATVDSPGKELSAWRDVIAVVTQLRRTGACNLPAFTPAAISGIANVNQIPCSHGAGTRLSGMNGIGVFLNSTLANTTARVDNPLDVSVLSSITVQIPSNLYTHVPQANVEAALAGIMGPLGYGAYAQKAALALQRGQNGEEFAPHYVKYGFFNGAAVNSAQLYGFTLILRCGPRENPYPYCRR